MAGAIEVNGTSYQLNVIPSVPDIRDWQFHLREDAQQVALARKVNLNPWFFYDQGQEGSCTGHAQAKLMRLLRRLQGLPDVDLSRAMAYYNGRLLEGTENQDAGCTIGDSILGLARWGICPEADFPYVVGGFGTRPSAAAYDDALNYKALKYEAVLQSKDIIAAALSLGHPVSMGFAVYESFENPDSRGVVPAPSGRLLGGHNVIITGYDWDLMPDYWLCDNSWGRWGAAINGCPGRFWLPKAWVENPAIAFEMKTVDLINGTPTPPIPKVVDAFGARWPDGTIKRLWPDPELPYPQGSPVGVGLHNSDGSTAEIWHA